MDAQVNDAVLIGYHQVRVFREKDQAENVEQVCNRWMKQNAERAEILNVQYYWQPIFGSVILVHWRYR